MGGVTDVVAESAQATAEEFGTKAFPDAEALLANAMILSAQRGKEVALPVDRDEYDALMDELCAGSRFEG